NLEKAREAQSARAHGAKKVTRSRGLSTAEQNDLPASAFAFSKERKEPLTDARHVRNAIARFDQVEDVSDAERDRAWGRIKRAAKKKGVGVPAAGGRDLAEGGKAGKRGAGGRPSPRGEELLVDPADLTRAVDEVHLEDPMADPPAGIVTAHRQRVAGRDHR